MANTFQNASAYRSDFQMQIYENFVGNNIVTSKFEGEFEGNDTVHFFRQTKPTVSAMASSYSDIPVQDVVQTDETFTLDLRYGGVIGYSDEDMKRINTDVDSRAQSIKGWSEAYTGLFDDDIMAEYASAGSGLDVTDGDMDTATNSGGTNSIILTKSIVWEAISKCNLALDLAKVSQNDRWLMVTPQVWNFLSRAPELTRSTDMGDQVVKAGYTGFEIDGIKLYKSTNIYKAASARYCLFGQGKPINFASLVKPDVKFVSSDTQSQSFVNYLKSMTKFGTKTFSEGAERLGYLKIYEA
jgi:hypothetical protein